MINSWHVPLFPLKPFGIGQHFLVFLCSSDSSGMTLGNRSSAKSKVNTIKTRHVMIRKLILLGT